MSEHRQNQRLISRRAASSVKQSKIDVSHQIQDKIKEAIQKINNQGRYQKVLFTIMTFAFVLSCYFLNASGFLFMNPKIQCNNEETSQDDACLKFDQCTVKNDYTLTYRNKLFCGQKADQRNLIQSMMGLGALFGVIVINILSDFKGRRFSFLLAIFIQIVSSAMVVGGTYLDSIALFTSSQFLGGFASASLWTVYYVICDKLSSKKWGQLTVLIANIGYGLALSSMIIFSDLLDWSYYTYIILVGWSVVLLPLTAWLLVEDPIFLYTKQKFEQCRNSLRKIAKFNKTEEHWQQVEAILRYLLRNKVSIMNDEPDEAPSWTDQFAYLKSFKEREVFQPAFLFGVLQLASFTTTFVIFYSSNDVGYSYGINSAILGVAVILALAPMSFFSHLLRRKMGCLLCSIGQILLSGVFYFDLPKLAQTLLYGGITFFALAQYAIYIFWIVETFPQHIQSTSFAAVQTLGEVGKFISPLLVRAANSNKISPALVITAADLVLGLGFIFCLKQTLVPRSKTLYEQPSD